MLGLLRDLLTERRGVNEEMSFNDKTARKPPCGGCKERRVSPNCHDECRAYIEWLNVIRLENEKLREEKRSIMAQESQLRAISVRRRGKG